MITAVTSGKAAPGTTTTTWALALAWPGDLLVVDADPAGGDMTAGLLAGRMTADRGLLSWMLAARHGRTGTDTAAALASHVVEIPEVPRVWVLPGFVSGAQAQSVSADTWDRLTQALTAMSADENRDCLVDVGRLTGPHPHGPVLRAADRVLLVVRSSVRSVHAAQAACAVLRADLGDLTRVSAVVVGEGPYPASEVAAALDLPLAGVLPHDPHTAAVLSDGARSRGALDRTALVRAARSLGETLAAAVPGATSTAGAW